MIISYIILGVIAWQTVCCIIAFVIDSEDVTTYISIGIWTPILMVIGKIYQKARVRVMRKYNYYQIFGEENNNSMNSWITNICMTPKTAAKFRTFDEYGYNYTIKLLTEGKDFKSYPMKHEIVKEGQMFPGMPEDLFKKFLKNP